jgi:hypothetical protein
MKRITPVSETSFTFDDVFVDAHDIKIWAGFTHSGDTIHHVNNVAFYFYNVAYLWYNGTVITAADILLLETKLRELRSLGYRI